MLEEVLQESKDVWTINALSNLVKPGTDIRLVFNFLKKVFKERKGAQIGFNQNLTKQGRLGTQHTRDVATFDETELVIVVDSGVVSLEDSVAAIQPKGVYEKWVLQQLGIN